MQNKGENRKKKNLSIILKTTSPSEGDMVTNINLVTMYSVNAS